MTDRNEPSHSFRNDFSAFHSPTSHSVLHRLPERILGILKMPFYSCVFRSVAPSTRALALAEDDEKEESSLRLLSRIVKENGCSWLLQNLIPIADSIKNQQEKLGKDSKVTIEAWRLMPHLRFSFSLLMEIVAAADLADESIANIGLYNFISDKVRSVPPSF